MKQPVNAFTAPRRPFFSEAELRQMRRADGGRRGGQTRHQQDGGTVYTTTKIKPSERTATDASTASTKEVCK